MKKLFALILALAMILTLAACGGGDEKTPSNNDKTPSNSQQQPQNTPDPDEGEDEPEQTPDEGGAGAAWPKNEFTALIPKPTSGTVADEKAVDNAYFEGHKITMTNWPVEDCKAYAEELIAAGFTQPGAGADSVVVTDSDSTYSFGAVNENGVYVTIGVGVAQKTGNISIQVQKEG